MLCRKYELSCLLALFLAVPLLADGPGQATGFKVGEVTATSATIWTRTSLHSGPNPPDAPMFEIEYEGSGGRRRQIQSRAFPERSRRE